MGCFDSVMVPCPSCGVEREFQSKSGECILKTYKLKDAPADVLEDVNRHAPLQCDCGVYFMVEFDEAGKPHSSTGSAPQKDWKQELESTQACLQATQERCDEYRIKAEGWQAAYWALVKVLR